MAVLLADFPTTLHLQAEEQPSWCGPMHITFSIEGGFAGLTRSTTVDTDALDAKDRDDICHLVEGAQFFQRAQPPQPQGGADRFTYTITASAAGKQRTLSFTDPIGDPKVADLVAALRRLMRKQQ